MKRFSVLLGCFIGLAVSTPAILMIPLGLFLKPMTAEFGWSRTQFSVVVAAAGVCTAIMMPLAGFLVDRFGPRRIILIGVVLGTSFYAGLSQVTSFPLFVGLACLAVSSGSLAGYPAYLGLVERWFDRRLGLALAIASAGVAIGVAGSSWAITLLIRSHDWRHAFLTVGCAAFAIGLANTILLIRDNRGPVPESERTESTTDPHAGLSLGEALRTADFWLCASSFTLILVATVGVTFHLPALLADAGGSPSQIASVVATVSAGSLIGRLITGAMLDRWSMRLVATLFYGGQAIGLLLLLVGMRWALAAGFLLGMIQGAEIDLMGYLLARRFGRRAYARILGTCFAITLMAVVVSPVLTAQIYDRTGSYDLGLAAFPALSLLALGLLLRVRYQRPAAGPSRRSLADA